ncbi:unnamed protein product, partial [marine sediment metagenome]
HPYTPAYYDLFKDRRKSAKKVLELGVLEGRSLMMWREFFPNAHIYGIDVNEDCIRIFEDDDRVTVFEYDQTSPRDMIELIDKIGSDIDIVVDDGSHIPPHQIYACLTLMKLIDKGVIYVVEDVKAPRPRKGYLGIKFFLRGYDVNEPNLEPIRKKYGIGRHRGDDRLIVVKHREKGYG